MLNPSREVQSAQIGIHPRLLETLQRHLRSAWQQPIHTPTLQAFERLRALGLDQSQAILLDSGCGTGESTLQLAAQYPAHCVIGIDQSAARLARLAPIGIARHGNAILMRAELSSFWRLFVAAGWQADRHYLLYPNPWPKAAHLGRRWHGHPVFPTLLRSARSFELRTNWCVYAEEFAFALDYAGCSGATAEAFVCDEAMTPFERKYRDSGHELRRVVSTPVGGAPTGAASTAPLHRW
jgi:tRNA (guanine-N7-)-methyltransferase